MADNQNGDTSESLVSMSMKKLLFIIGIGVMAGLASWGLTLLLDTYIYKAILCSGNTAVQCASSYQYAMTTATIIGAAAGLFALVRLHAYRPLLIVIASFVALWGLFTLVSPLAWYVQALFIALLYGFAFGAIGWLARVKKFYLAIIAIVIVVVVTRLVLNS